MSIPELDVDLNAPPERRWEALEASRPAARAMLDFYVQDLGGLGPFGPILSDYRAAYVDPEYAAEMRGVARVLDVPEEKVFLANIYYDAMKLVLCGSMGCTGFAIDTRLGPLHARNLDWSTANGRLAKETGVPALDPALDRCMVCGSPSMLADTRALLERLGFVEGSMGEQGSYVIERAFVER